MNISDIKVFSIYRTTNCLDHLLLRNLYFQFVIYHKRYVNEFYILELPNIDVNSRDREWTPFRLDIAKNTNKKK